MCTVPTSLTLMIWHLVAHTHTRKVQAEKEQSHVLKSTLGWHSCFSQGCTSNPCFKDLSFLSFKKKILVTKYALVLFSTLVHLTYLSVTFVLLEDKQHSEFGGVITLRNQSYPLVLQLKSCVSLSSFSHLLFVLEQICRIAFTLV